ncbi:hypothetical protein LOD99_11186 [Oopsacas minuta]|uniref:Uncharacterized protein n=1 Tax=Oopsacas minuta TaxID=111878 RepID=A0AAV7K872_9METZ|nr:hypothetical protein LOD99_11186 [Oopsacas minuta]
MLKIWKAFHYSPKKAEKLSLTQAELQSPEIKMVKPFNTLLLARERAVCVVRRSIPAWYAHLKRFMMKLVMQKLMELRHSCQNTKLYFVSIYYQMYSIQLSSYKDFTGESD